MFKKVNPEFKKYVFKTEMISLYQMFWITYEMLKISPNSDLEFDKKEINTLVTITNSNLSNSQIHYIFDEHYVDFEQLV